LQITENQRQKSFCKGFVPLAIFRLALHPKHVDNTLHEITRIVAKMTMKKDNVCMTLKLTQCDDFELPGDSDELST
jgi:hypothetical protein